ncbi:MAG: transcriptional repressor [Patescibacteria group bacterium]
MKKNQWVTDLIQNAGHKLTGPRKKIATWIAEHPGVFSVGELQKSLPALDGVSIYRTIELFTELDIVHPILTSHGEQHYETHEKKHHHHVVCTGCEKSECVSCDIGRSRVSGFTQLHHSVVFTGLCVSCSHAA